MNKTNDRVSYIILYSKNGIKYVFNRSISWYSLLPSKYLGIINAIGANYLVERISKFIIEKDLCCRNIDEIESFVETHNNFTIIEILPEYKNIKNADQVELNKKKIEYCEKLNAEYRIDKLPLDCNMMDDESIFKLSYLKKDIIDWLNEIWNEFCNFRKDNENTYFDNKNILDTKFVAYRNYVNDVMNEIAESAKKDTWVLLHKEDTMLLKKKIIDYKKYLNIFND